MILCSIVNQTSIDDNEVLKFAEQALFLEDVCVPQLKVTALNILKRAINES